MAALVDPRNLPRIQVRQPRRLPPLVSGTYVYVLYEEEPGLWHERLVLARVALSARMWWSLLIKIGMLKIWSRQTFSPW
jgi:hypothetical protein